MTLTCDRAYALRNGQSNARIPNGIVVKGAVSYSKPWSWHIDSEQIWLAEICAEICDGRPSYVEANVDDWAGSTFCPWSAEPVSVIDYR